MKWIKTGRQIGRAVKNAQRLQHILVVFARYGFADAIQRIKLGRYLPTRFYNLTKIEQDSKTAAQRLRQAFEELGPTFVKLGQLLSTRPDLLPESYIEEFTKLQDNVSPLAFEQIKPVIEQELKGPINSFYKEFNEKPLASASIAQVHEAVLHSGERVVVKVQRPGIKKLIDGDISLLAMVAKLLEQYVPELRLANPTVIVEEFFKTLSLELNFFVEANNIQKMAENLSAFEKIIVPTVYRNLSTSRVLTLQKLDGIRLNDLAAIERAGINTKELVDLGARAFFKTVMIDGLFHGDLHGGNIFALPGDRIGIIDFGIVGRLSRKSRDQFANMIMSLVTEDYENLCYLYAELGAADPSIDFDGFQREVRNTISPYIGLNLSEVNSGRIFIDATKVAAKYRIRVPGDWMIVFKALLTMEGMGRSLDPTFDLFATGKDLVKDLVKDQYSVQRMSKDAFWVLKDFVALLEVLPRQLRWMMRKFNRNDFAFELKLPQLDAVREEAKRGSKRTSLSILAAGLFVASSLALEFSDQTVFGYPALSVIFGALASVILLRVLFL